MVMEATQCATCGSPTYSTCHDCRELTCGSCLITHECDGANTPFFEAIVSDDEVDDVIFFAPEDATP